MAIGCAMSTSDKVAALVDGIGLKPERIAYLMGVSRGDVTRWLHGKVQPRPIAMQSLRMLFAIRQVAPAVVDQLRSAPLEEYLCTCRATMPRRLLGEIDPQMPRPYVDGADEVAP